MVCDESGKKIIVDNYSNIIHSKKGYYFVIMRYPYFLNQISVRMLLFLGFGLVVFSVSLILFLLQGNAEKKQQVLGRNTAAPQIFISGLNQKYNSGGVIPIASTDEPSVQIGGYKISGKAEIALYQANKEALLTYLLHNKDGNQIEKSPDVNSFQYVTTVTQDINITSYSSSRVLLPLTEKGIWYVTVTIGKTKVDAFIVRSSIGVIAEEGDNEFIFWGQSFVTKRSISEGTLILLNLEQKQKILQTVSFGASGIATAKLNKDADIALVNYHDEVTFVPLNLAYLNTGYSYKQFHPKAILTRYFIFTDRPLYKPGDTVYFKAVLRDDDDARYTIPSGLASVRIYNDYYYEGSNLKPVFENTVQISSDGTINGHYRLPADATTGHYTVAVSIRNQGEQPPFWGSEWVSNTNFFTVEFFKKPEFSLDITTLKTELIAGDKSSFTIKGDYFSGQPLADKPVSYTVYSADFYEYQYLTDQKYFSYTISDKYRYGYWMGNHKVMEGTAVLDKNGEAVIDLETSMDFNKGKSQVFSIEVNTDGAQTPSFARRNILVYAGEYGIYRTDSSYGAKVNTTLSLPVVLKSYYPTKKTDVSSVSLTAKVHRTQWISYKEKGKKGYSYKKEEEDLPSLQATTNSQGDATFSFTPKKIGSYTITVEGKDARGNLIAKIFHSYVSDQEQPAYTENGSNELTIAADKQLYQPTDTVRFTIFSAIPDRDVFLSLERGRVNRFQVIHVNGKNATVDIPLTSTDIPNIYAKVASFSQFEFDETTIDIPVSAESKQLVVHLDPERKTFGPGDTVRVAVSTTDVTGKPVSADLALWAVDKAIFELSENNLGNIFDTFWHKRFDMTQFSHSLQGVIVQTAEQGGGCFAAGTQVLMADGTQKSIEKIQKGEYIFTHIEKDAQLVKARVQKTHKATVSGFMILNGTMKVTPNHMLRVNDSWKEAGSIQPGDSLIDRTGKSVSVDSIEWQRGVFPVYNLEVETYHTYFADNFWVHNQKGIERNVFKDTAYWNPTLHTDASGKANVTFKLPDNLTTWTIAAVGSTVDTKVGQTTQEVVVSKNVIVRPVLPNILRVGDDIILSAVVQNFTQKDQIFDVNLTFDSGDVIAPKQSTIVIKANESKEVYWKVKPKKENGNSKLVFSASAQGNKQLADIVTQKIPVKLFGFTEKRVEAGDGAKTYQVKFASDTRKDKSSLIISLSPTMFGTLPIAMQYLLSYPYGCVEQTTSRFVPAVIAKANPGIFTDALQGKDLNGIIEKGIERLAFLQQEDGGWSWWLNGNSDPYITSYVVEYLLQARATGTPVDEGIVRKAKSFLEKKTYYDPDEQKNVPYSREDIIAKNYALTLLGEGHTIQRVYDLTGLTPDIISLAVKTNYLNGDRNPQSNGLQQLLSMRQTEGETFYWKKGDAVHFGSRDASTALALQAIVLARGERSIAVRASQYLTRARRADYWSNTYATAQVIRALVDLSKTGSEVTPNYRYSLSLDGTILSQGIVVNAKQVIPDMSIPPLKIKKKGSTLALSKQGSGQLYSTLAINEFHTDNKAPARNHGLSVKRKYINEKGEQYTLGVGDTALVMITVGGLRAGANYGIIQDELPSGLVPINPQLKNEQYGSDPGKYYRSGVSDREVTENGMILSLSKVASGERTYTYKARVVSEGTFHIPPATAALMYSPDVYGLSSAQTITTTKESQLIPSVALKKTVENYLLPLSIVFFVIIVVGGIIILKKRGVIFSSKKPLV